VAPGRADEPPPPPRPLRDVALVVGGRGPARAGRPPAGAVGDRDRRGPAGLSELVVGLTVVAIGTSLPELATS
jgi:Ca2+/Na+ antiporter